MVPQPEDIYRRTKEEGERRLERPLLEMISTALAAGFDIVAGVDRARDCRRAASRSASASSRRTSAERSRSASASSSSSVGRGELFTENFLVPIAGLDHGAAAHGPGSGSSG